MWYWEYLAVGSLILQARAAGPRPRAREQYLSDAACGHHRRNQGPVGRDGDTGRGSPLVIKPILNGHRIVVWQGDDTLGLELLYDENGGMTD